MESSVGPGVSVQHSASYGSGIVHTDSNNIAVLGVQGLNLLIKMCSFYREIRGVEVCELRHERAGEATKPVEKNSIDHHTGEDSSNDTAHEGCS